MHRNIVIGPPGTGKTTYLKNKVQELLKSGACRSQEIGYFSFTVKAAEEIRDGVAKEEWSCLLYTSPSPRDRTRSRMPSSA